MSTRDPTPQDGDELGGGPVTGRSELAPRRLARRTVASVAWTTTSNVLSLSVLVVRSILLARWLPVHVFGSYALAHAVVDLTGIVTGFGMAGAFLHRSAETQDEDAAASTHCTLRLLFTVAWAVALGAGTLVLTSQPIRNALLVLIGVRLARGFTQTPILILRRRVVHRRIAVLTFIEAVVGTVTALGLAYFGFTLSALLSIDVAGAVAAIFVLYVWRPVWRPRLSWSTARIRYFLRFGSRNLLAAVLQTALARVDDLWVGTYLHHRALGFYSRAYTFATYPRRVIALPIMTVIPGTFSALKGQRERLSQAYHLANAFLARSGFLLASVLVLVAPELIEFGLGPRWMPMLPVFRLMLVFALVDPIKDTAAYLFVAVGHPEMLIRCRLIQVAVLVPGMYVLGTYFGLSGVAVAVTAALVTGTTLIFVESRRFVDLQVTKMFGPPALAIGVAFAVTTAVVRTCGAVDIDWRNAVIKCVAFVAVYAVVLLLAEGRQLMDIYRQLRSLARTRGEA
ncbi:oligosaccharide flippase family protein [Planctomycetota bacterium]